MLIYMCTAAPHPCTLRHSLQPRLCIAQAPAAQWKEDDTFNRNAPAPLENLAWAFEVAFEVALEEDGVAAGPGGLVISTSLHNVICNELFDTVDCFYREGGGSGFMTIQSHQPAIKAPPLLSWGLQLVKAGGYMFSHFHRCQPLLQLHADKEERDQDYSLLLRGGPNGRQGPARCFQQVDLHTRLLGPTDPWGTGDEH